MLNYKKRIMPGCLDVRVMPGGVSPAEVVRHNHHEVRRGRSPGGGKGEAGEEEEDCKHLKID